MTDTQITDAVVAFQWIAFTYQFNMTGQPAATVPAGFTKDGLTVT